MEDPNERLKVTTDNQSDRETLSFRSSSSNHNKWPRNGLICTGETNNPRIWSAHNYLPWTHCLWRQSRRKKVQVPRTVMFINFTVLSYLFLTLLAGSTRGSIIMDENHVAQGSFPQSKSAPDYIRGKSELIRNAELIN